MSTTTLKPFTEHATLPEGSATLQNLLILISLSKTIAFPTFKTQFCLLIKLEVDSVSSLPPFLYNPRLGKKALAYKRGTPPKWLQLQKEKKRRNRSLLQTTQIL